MAHRVRLEMLNEQHAPALHEAGTPTEIWRYLPGQAFRCLGDARAWILEALGEYHRGTRIPFAIVETETDRAIGSTSFINLRKAHQGVMIGMTWLSPEFHGTGVNTECKLLLLTHAFEVMNAIRVEFRIDERNVKSLRAVERLGAVKEGTLRAHMVEKDGFIRNSVYYSVIRNEWHITKEQILALINKPNEELVPNHDFEVSMCS